MNSMMIENFNFLINCDISNLSKNEKLSYYRRIKSKIDMVMNDKDIDLNFYQKLLILKKRVMSKILNVD